MEAAPGTPVLLDGYAVGMHLVNKKAMLIKALVSELQQVSSFHIFSNQINDLLTQIVFN